MTLPIPVPVDSNKLMFIGGSTNQTEETGGEYLELGNIFASCPDIPTHPDGNRDGHSAVYVPSEDRVLSCLGAYCHTYDFSAKEWSLVEDAGNAYRKNAALIAVPNGSGDVLILGGTTSSKTQFYNHGVYRDGPNIPYGKSMTGPCHAVINDTHAFVADLGGLTYAYDSAFEYFYELPDPRVSRTAAACGVIPKTGEYLLAGGFDEEGNGLNSTEIYDPRTYEWREGPELPEVAFGGQLFSYGEDSLVWAGNSNRNVVFQLIGNGWVERTEKLKSWRKYAGVTKIPEDKITC